MSLRRAKLDWSRASVSLGRKVQARREELGLTQEQLAEMTGISRNQVQNIEHSRNNTRGDDGRPGPGNPRMETIFLLAAALDVDPSYLIDVTRLTP